jgi:hypothetical protein
VYLCYVDESGDTGPRGSRHLLLGAAALFEGRWSYVSNDFDNLISHYFPAPPRPREIHCADVRGGRDEFAPLSRQQRQDLLADACRIVTGMLETEVRLFTVIVDKGDWFARNGTRPHEEMYLDAFEELVSRFDLYLRRRHAEGQSSKGILIADPHTTGLTAALKAALHRFQTTGTRWANVYNIVETAFFLDSHESPGLQLADLCSYAVWRLVEFGDHTLANLIDASFDREPPGGRNPGKWHGVKYLGHDPVVDARIRAVWPYP